jgi:solute carrier family 25 (mitochondrial 2-oxodicarboxylate transporter), member 21
MYLVIVVTLLPVRLMNVFREGAPSPIALYKGFVPKVLRLTPGGGLLLLVVELTLGLF